MIRFSIYLENTKLKRKKYTPKKYRSLKSITATDSPAELLAENIVHRSVLLRETVELLNAGGGGTFIDATLGLGGHTEAILQSSDETRVIGIDQDTSALEKAKKRLEVFGDRFCPVHANFSALREVWQNLGEPAINGILADLGVSSFQLDTPERGFSFRFDAPLDMRMNQAEDTATAADLLENLSEEELANIIFEFGEERLSRRIARKIVEDRNGGKTPRTTRELAGLIERTIRSKEKIHPATRTFQALRIAVNRELDILPEFIDAAADILQPAGRFAVIAFHSLEDRIIKNAFRRLAGQNSEPLRLPIDLPKRIEIVTRRPIQASDEELLQNPRARSAKLRVCQKNDNRTEF